ncbi:MAG: glycoside hydrolase family 88 protein [Akkermansiaceae bacterium]
MKAEAPAGEDALMRSIPATLDFAGAQYSRLLASAKEDPKIPRTFENGKLVTVGPKDWTSGFIAGSLWYLYEFSQDPKWLAAAQDYTNRLESIKDYRGSHDVGFMLGCSYGHGYRLTKNPAYRTVLLDGAASLAMRFNPQVGQLRSWDHGKWSFPVIIDNMMNLEFLMSATRESGETRFKEISISHADHTLKHHFRPDFSSFHVVDYDPANGEVLAKKTHQGAADDSAWARGQAWGLYGYTMMFRETGNPAYLEQAVQIGNFILKHPRLPADKIPYWDFDAPDIPSAPRDASAAAIMSSALIELSGLTQGEQSAAFLELARQQLRSLSSPAYLAKAGDNGNFLLMHSVGHLPKPSEVDVPLNYADYYFLEALLRYQKSLQRP